MEFISGTSFRIFFLRNLCYFFVFVVERNLHFPHFQEKKTVGVNYGSFIVYKFLKYSVWLKTEEEKHVFHYSVFPKIAVTVPLIIFWSEVLMLLTLQWIWQMHYRFVKINLYYSGPVPGTYFLGSILLWPSSRYLVLRPHIILAQFQVLSSQAPYYSGPVPGTQFLGPILLWSSSRYLVLRPHIILAKSKGLSSQAPYYSGQVQGTQFSGPI